jgi:hypothetical protein
MLIKRLAKIKSSNRKYLMKDGVLEHQDEQMYGDIKKAIFGFMTFINDICSLTQIL